MLVSMKQKTKTQEPTPRAFAHRISRADRLQFVVRFAQLDLTTLRRGDWLNLREEMEWFLIGIRYEPGFDFGTDEIPVQAGDLVVHPDDPPTSDAFTPEACAQLQADLRTLLSGLAPAPGVVPGQTSSLPFHGAWSIVEGRPGQPVVVAVGATRDLFLFQVMMLLKDEHPHPIRRCAECGALFYGHGNQDYCSRPCVNRVSQRRWRARRETVTA
jgi:hypothetical protein